jgi:hypothetical protein
VEFTERELEILRWAMHMAYEEGGWEYSWVSNDGATWEEQMALYQKLGGVVKTVTMTNGQPNTYFASPDSRSD